MFTSSCANATLPASSKPRPTHSPSPRFIESCLYLDKGVDRRRDCTRTVLLDGARLGRTCHIDEGAAGLRGVVLGNVLIDLDVDARGADEAEVLADAVLGLGAHDGDLLVDDREARELVGLA